MQDLAEGGASFRQKESLVLTERVAIFSLIPKRVRILGGARASVREALQDPGPLQRQRLHRAHPQHCLSSSGGHSFIVPAGARRDHV